MQKIIVTLALLLFAAESHAYIGPGLGAGAIAVVLGVLGSIFVALFAVFWYPIKRILKSKKGIENDDVTPEEASANEASAEEEKKEPNNEQ